MTVSIQEALTKYNWEKFAAFSMQLIPIFVTVRMCHLIVRLVCLIALHDWTHLTHLFSCVPMMIKALNEAFLPYLVKADAFRTHWLPKLYQNVKGQVADMWKRESDVYRTLGSDGFTGEDRNKMK